MNHTFLFIEARWKATGRFMDEIGIVSQVEGETQIHHKPGMWVNTSTLKILGENRMGFENQYEIKPFQDGNDHTTWESSNPSLGKFHGLFVIIGESILSTYQTEDGSYKGVEHLQKLNEDKYTLRGALFSENKKISSWDVELIRVI